MSSSPLHAPPFPLSGAVLAGGRSSRMGRDKAFLTYQGQTLVARQATLLRAAGVDDLMISGRTGIDYGVDDARVIFDSLPNAGPAAGLSAVLHAARHPWVLILAVDLPRVSLGALRTLIQASAGRVGTVPCDKEHGYEPLVSLLPRTMASHIDQSVAEQQLALQSIFGQAERLKLIQSFRIESFAIDTFANWNTPEDITGELPS